MNVKKGKKPPKVRPWGRTLEGLAGRVVSGRGGAWQCGWLPHPYDALSRVSEAAPHHPVNPELLHRLERVTARLQGPAHPQTYYLCCRHNSAGHHGLRSLTPGILRFRSVPPQTPGITHTHTGAIGTRCCKSGFWGGRPSKNQEGLPFAHLRQPVGRFLPLPSGFDACCSRKPLGTSK